MMAPPKGLSVMLGCDLGVLNLHVHGKRASHMGKGVLCDLVRAGSCVFDLGR